MTTGERKIRVDLPKPAELVAQDEAEHKPPWWRRNLRVIVTVTLVVLAGVLYVNSRVNPPPSPPNAATEQQLQKLRSDLDSYLAGRGGLRDQQYAKTVYTLCVLAQDAGEADILNDPDYQCAQLLASPPPSVPSAPPVTSASPSASTSSSRPSSTATVAPSPARTTPAAAGPTTAPSSTPTPTRSATPTATPLVPGLLCALPTLPVLPICTGG